jgi:hypothetical protein
MHNAVIVTHTTLSASQFADGTVTSAPTRAAAGTVVLVEPARPPYELTARLLHDLRTGSA